MGARKCTLGPIHFPLDPIFIGFHLLPPSPHQRIIRQIQPGIYKPPAQNAGNNERIFATGQTPGNFIRA